MHRSNRSIATLAIVAAATLAFGVTAQGAITYVDATSAVNTYDSGGTLGDAVTGWNIRTGFANTTAPNNDVFEAQTSVGIPEITTEVSVASNVYNVYVFMWDANTANDLWTIDAGLTSGSLTRYTNDNPVGVTANTVLASSLTYDTPPSIFIESNRTLYAVNLGQVAGSTIKVFVDSSASNNVDRVWYDGIGYEVVPEPASLALLGLGSLLIVSRRRRG